MIASVVKQDPNTKRFKRMLIYFNTDTVCKFLGKSPLLSHKTTLKRPKTMKNERKRLILFGFSFYNLFGAWNIVGISPNSCIRCVRVKINKHSFEPFCILTLTLR